MRMSRACRATLLRFWMKVAIPPSATATMRGARRCGVPVSWRKRWARCSRLLCLMRNRGCITSGAGTTAQFGKKSLESRMTGHTRGGFQIRILSNSWKLSFNISYYKRKTRSGKTLCYPAAASSCTYAIEPPCTGWEARRCKRLALYLGVPPYSILPLLTTNY